MTPQKLKEEAIIYAVKNICLNHQNFSLEKCLEKLGEKNILVTKSTLARYLKNFGISFDKVTGWDFSKMDNFTYSVNELQSFNCLEKSNSNKDEMNEYLQENIIDPFNQQLEEVKNTNKMILERLELLEEKNKERQLLRNENVTLQNYLQVSGDIRSTLKPQESTTVVISFRVSQEFKNMYTQFSRDNNIQHSELISALIYQFVNNNN